MPASLVDKLIGISPQELALLRKLKEVGAASVDELAVKLNRGGDDLTPEITNLVTRNLIHVKKFRRGEDRFEVYLTAPEVRSLL